MSKPFSFTYSKLKNFEKCPLQHKVTDIERRPGTEPGGDAISYGNKVHSAFKAALKHNEALAPDMSHLQYWVDWVKDLPGERFIEEKWGLNRNMATPAEFFSNFAWLRLIVDVAVVHREAKIGWLVDWKTGDPKWVGEQPLQLWLGAAVMFSKFPELETVDSMFVWLKDDDGTNSHECITAETVRKPMLPEIWEAILPRVELYEQTVAADGPWLSKPGSHCKFCRVLKPECEYGK